MQFIVLAYDGTDEDAPVRRQACREAHLARVEKLVAEGRMLSGGAILDSDGIMRGSMILVEFPSRRELDEWLAADPYVTGQVWQQIEVKPFRLAPPFERRSP